MKKHSRKPAAASRQAPVASKPVSRPKPNIFDTAEAWLQARRNLWLLVIPLILGTLFALLTFDVKISEGNDDAMYIEAATKIAADFTGYFYTANAPMYPMVLGVITMVTGFNLVLYKVLNVIFFLLHLALMYYAFRGRIPNLVLLPVLLLSAVNAYYLYYASQTYTEMLFVCLQALAFLAIFRWQDRRWASTAVQGEADANPLLPERKHSFTGTDRIKWALAIGTAIFLMTFCKNIAIAMLGAVVLYFLIARDWRSLGDALGGYLVVRFTFEGIKALVWGATNQYGSQGAILLQKDAYNPAAGQEDVAGFIARFFENFNIYVSRRLFQILGFRDADSPGVYAILSLLVFAVVVFVFWKILRTPPSILEDKSSQRKNRNDKLHLASRHAGHMLLVSIYVTLALGLTFLVLQVKWDQPRLIMVYVPLFVMMVLYGLYSWLNPVRENKNSRTGAFILYLAASVILTSSSLITTIKKSVAHYPVLKKNLGGDLYYGYTPDWENFLRLSEWCADSLPSTAYVASRKAPMSFVYGKGKPFFPVYTVIAVDTVTNLSHPDSVLQLFRENKVTHVLLGQLRRNPLKADGYFINTLHRMLIPVAQKYPDKVKLVKQIGVTEPAYLYEVKP